MILTVLLMSTQVLLIGGLLAITPRIMPATECFAVTVPPSARQDPRIKGYLRSYAQVVGIVTVVCALAQALLLPCVMGDDPSSRQAVFASSLVITATMLTPLVVAFALMLHYRSCVQALKQAEGWAASAQQAASPVGEQIPQPISLAWNLLHVVLALAMTVFALVNYDRFPAQIPMNTDFSGTVTTYADKSVGVVLFPAILVGYMGLVFAATHWAIIISKQPVDPAAPATSALAYGRFARIQSQLMLVGGLVISASIGGMFYLTSLGIVSMMVAASALMVIVILFVSAMIIISVRLGQSGARLAAELRPNDILGRDDDSHWYLGTLYFNRDDPSIIVPKRFGIGWTINNARPAAWVMMASILVLTLLFCLWMQRTVG